MAPIVKPRNLGTPPILAGGKHENGVVVYERSLEYKSNTALRDLLMEWVGRYVSRQSVMPLMLNASGLPEIMNYMQHAPTTLSGTRRFKLHLVWDKLSDNQWYVEGIGFSLTDNMRNIHTANISRIREVALDAAEKNAMNNPADWKLYFNLDQAGADWQDDVRQGTSLIDAQFPVAHKAAAALVPVLKNPIGPDFDSDEDILKELGKAVVGVLPLPDALANAWAAGDAASKVKGNMEDGSGFKAAGDVMDLGASLISKNPIVGLGSTILGSFLSIAIAGDAARVAKARGRLYVLFVSGFLSNIFKPPISEPVAPARNKPGSRALYYIDKMMFDLGAKQSSSYSARQKYLVQLALMHFVATHNTEKEWSFKNRVEKGWQHPVHYKAYWSRELLARSFVWQFFKGKYRYK